MAERMKAHVQASATTPLLIFPEGTCVNNEYCVMFKRGAFDLGATVCPVAIKYNKIFVDAFWNSKRQSFTAHLVRGPESLTPGALLGGPSVVLRRRCAALTRAVVPRADQAHDQLGSGVRRVFSGAAGAAAGRDRDAVC